jgi:hypothetical protein
MRRAAWAAGLSICAGCWVVAGGAHAQEPAGAPAAETPAAPAAKGGTAAPTGADADIAAASDEPGNQPTEPRFADANSDRVVLFSTAETHPKGTFFFSDYELFLLQFGYAITDGLQIALSGVPPIIKKQPYFFDLSVKGNVLRSDYVRVAVIGAGTAVLVPEASPSSLFGARANGVAQLCFEKLCRSSFSFNAGTFLNSESNVIIPITLAGGAVLHASNLVKFLVEPAYALVVGEGVTDQPEGFLIDYGVRLSGKNFGFDLAFLLPVGAGEDSPFILGVPWLALTYRTDGAAR